MDRHPLDPIALVTGVLALVGGLIALLHQLGAFHLTVGAVALIGCGLLGAGGAALVLLTSRPSSPAGDGAVASDS